MIYLLTLTWNAEDKLTKLKESLLPALDGLDYAWFIKDNASKDNTVATASTWGDRVKVIAYKNNQQNFSAGMNYLFNAAKPQDNDYVILLNNDIIFNDKESIKKMIELMKNDDSIGVVGARLLYTNTDTIQHGGVVFNNNHRMPIHFRAGQKSDANAEKNRTFQVVTGAVALTRAEYFKNSFTQNPSGINGMDENFQWAFDDVDMCLSISHNMNKKIVYCGETNISHEESVSLKKNPVNKMFLSSNVQRLKNKWENKYQLDQNEYMRDSRFNLYRKKV